MRSGRSSTTGTRFDEGRLVALLDRWGVRTTQPTIAACELGLSIVEDCGPAGIGGLNMISALEGETIRLYRRGIESHAAEAAIAQDRVRALAVAHETIHALAARHGEELDEATVHRLAQEWILHAMSRDG